VRWSGSVAPSRLLSRFSPAPHRSRNSEPGPLPNVQCIIESAAHAFTFTTHTRTMSNTVRRFTSSTSLAPYKSDCAKMLKHYTRLQALWPKDLLRPNLPFTRAIEHRGLPYGLKPLESTPQEKAPKNASPVPAPSSPPNPSAEQVQVNALYSLLENRYSKKYPLSPGVLRPTSAPEHYDRLMDEIERAPQKSWWQAKVDEWKMKIRWT
jgi:cytochrome b pre-mRNA-processing protein 6